MESGETSWTHTRSSMLKTDTALLLVEDLALRPSHRTHTCGWSLLCFPSHTKGGTLSAASAASLGTFWIASVCTMSGHNIGIVLCDFYFRVLFSSSDYEKHVLHV